MNTRSAHLPTPSPSPNLYPVTTSPLRRRSTCSQNGKSNHILPPPPPSPPTLCLSYPSSHPSVQSSDPPTTSSVKQASATSRKSTKTQRKINHSIIEKRRRVRINDCLEALRSLVPGWEELKSLGAGAKEGEDEDSWASEGKGAGKEFKLEVLMRTVTYVRHLQDSITRLEAKRSDLESVDPDETEEEMGDEIEEENEDEDDDDDDDDIAEEEEEKPVALTQGSTDTEPVPTRSSSLPSISSLTSRPSTSRSALSFYSLDPSLSQSHFFFPPPPNSSSLSSPYLPKPDRFSLNPIRLPPVTKSESPFSSPPDMPSHQLIRAYSYPDPNSSTVYRPAFSRGLGLYSDLVKNDDHENKGTKRKRSQVVEEVEAASALLSFSNVRNA